jgi:hypothetical protein
MDDDVRARRAARYAERGARIERAGLEASFDPDAEHSIGDPVVETAGMIAAARARNAARGITMPDPVAEAEALLRGGDDG